MILVRNGDGAHMIERASVGTHGELAMFDEYNTPRFYPYGTKENAGQAHLKLFTLMILLRHLLILLLFLQKQ